MKYRQILLILVSYLLSGCSSTNPSSGEPWTENQLMPAEALKDLISKNETGLHIFSIGPSGLIKNAVEIGEAADKENLDKFKSRLSDLPRDSKIVIYCGCCPFADCPNIRPAFSLLNELKFSNHKLLNLPQNLKVDWVDKGYPMAD